jgi:3-oxoadipate enol-lactonase
MRVGRFVAVSAGRLFIDDRGRGPALLLVPGLGYASWSWEAQLPLAASWRLLAVDPRGAGRSFKPSAPYTIAEMAAELAEVVRVVDEPPVHVAGFSMGGYLALVLAARWPQVVRSLVLIATSSGGAGHLPVPDATRSAWLAAADLPPADYARSTMHLSFAPGWVDANEKDYERLLAARLAYPTPAACWRAQYEACEAYLSEGVDVASIDVPTLVIHGREDRVVPFGNGERLAATLPRGHFLALDGAGHLAHIECPAVVNAAIAGFLHGVQTAGGV